MNRLLLFCAMASGWAIVVGCDRDSESVSGLSTVLTHEGMASDDGSRQPLVDHPEYLNWQQFPVGTAVIRQKEVSNEFGLVRVRTRVRLAEKADASVTVEAQITVERPDAGTVENPPMLASFPKQFPLPARMQAEQFALPSLKAILVGEEQREACGQQFQTQVFTWDEVNEAGPMKVKLWWSHAMPGRMVRQEIDGHMHHSVEEVVEIPPGDMTP